MFFSMFHIVRSKVGVIDNIRVIRHITYWLAVNQTTYSNRVSLIHRGLSNYTEEKTAMGASLRKALVRRRHVSSTIAVAESDQELTYNRTAVIARDEQTDIDEAANLTDSDCEDRSDVHFSGKNAAGCDSDFSDGSDNPATSSEGWDPPNSKAFGYTWSGAGKQASSCGEYFQRLEESTMSTEQPVQFDTDYTCRSSSASSLETNSQFNYKAGGHTMFSSSRNLGAGHHDQTGARPKVWTVPPQPQLGARENQMSSQAMNCSKISKEWGDITSLKTDANEGPSRTVESRETMKRTGEPQCPTSDVVDSLEENAPFKSNEIQGGLVVPDSNSSSGLSSVRINSRPPLLEASQSHTPSNRRLPNESRFNHTSVKKSPPESVVRPCEISANDNGQPLEIGPTLHPESSVRVEDPQATCANIDTSGPGSDNLIHRTKNSPLMPTRSRGRSSRYVRGVPLHGLGRDRSFQIAEVSNYGLPDTTTLPLPVPRRRPVKGNQQEPTEGAPDRRRISKRRYCQRCHKKTPHLFSWNSAQICWECQIREATRAFSDDPPQYVMRCHRTGRLITDWVVCEGCGNKFCNPCCISGHRCRQKAFGNSVD